jgi:flagellar M-ring protein FliF
MIALLVGFFVLRPILKGLLKPAPMAMNVALAGPMPTVSVMVDDDDMTPDRVSTSPQLGSPALLAYEQKVGLAKRMAAENPKQVAQVVKSWVSDDGA